MGTLWVGYKEAFVLMPSYNPLIPFFIIGFSLKPLYADFFYQIHAFFREFDDPTKELKNIFATFVIVRVVFNQAVFILSLFIALNHPINRAFAIHHIVKGFFRDFSDSDMVVIVDAIPLFFSLFPHHNNPLLRRSLAFCIQRLRAIPRSHS